MQLVVFVVPGFIAWRVNQARRPQGEQKASEAVIQIAVYGVINTLLWSAWISPFHWRGWPTQLSDIIALSTQAIISPIILAFIWSWLVDQLAKKGWILWTHPTAWDWIFNKLTRDKNNAFALICTLKDGRRIAGAYVHEGFAALHPYDRDLLLGEVWTLDDEGRFRSRVDGARGIYVDKKDILTIELFDYNEMVQDVSRRTLEAKGKQDDRSGKGC